MTRGTPFLSHLTLPCMRLRRSCLRKLSKVLILLWGLAYSLTACVLIPANHSFVSPHEPITFSGFASQPGATIQITAYHKAAQEYREVAITTASTTPQEYNGDTLYPWNTSLLFTSVDQWECYWGQSDAPNPCTIPTGRASAQVIVNEIGVLNGLITFDPTGYACLAEKIAQGVGGYTAGVECRSVDWPILFLSWLT